MNKEHLYFVSDHFNLKQYDSANRDYLCVFSVVTRWQCVYIEDTTRSELFEGYWEIESDQQPHVWLFTRLPTEELARAVIEYIEETRILFV